MIRPSIIVFAGPVGSGKSTQMRLLASELKHKKIKVKLSFLKTGHIFAYLLEVFLAKMLASKRKDVYPIRALLEEKPHIFKKIFRLWLSLDVISISIKFLFTIYIPLKLGYIIIVEEYIPAVISDYIYLCRITECILKPESLAIALLLKLMRLGRFTQVVFLDAENDELRLRWKRRGSPYEKDDYLKMQRTTLLSISRKLSSSELLYINTGKQAVRETHQLIKKRLMGETNDQACRSNRSQH